MGKSVLRGVTGLSGKPTIDVRELAVADVEKLSRAQLRDIMYSIGKDKPVWDSKQLKDQIKLVVQVMKLKNPKDINSVESRLGISLPKDASYRFRGASTLSAPRGRPKLSQDGKGNKRVCAMCGQNARSSCFYSCCKNCCVQLKNPCTIHVLVGDSSKVIASRKGYGGEVPGYHADYSAFPAVPEVPSKAMPKLRDLRENLDAHQEESKEILEWRQQVSRMGDKAKEEGAMEAMDRYERNANLLTSVMKVESLEKLLVEQKEQAEAVPKIRKKALDHDFDAQGGQSKLSSLSPLEMFDNVPTPLCEILAKVSQAQTMEELAQRVQRIGGFKDISLEAIRNFAKWLGEPAKPQFRVLTKATAPRPDLRNVVDLEVTEK